MTTDVHGWNAPQGAMSGLAGLVLPDSLRSHLAPASHVSTVHSCNRTAPDCLFVDARYETRWRPPWRDIAEQVAPTVRFRTPEGLWTTEEGLDNQALTLDQREMNQAATSRTNLLYAESN